MTDQAATPEVYELNANGSILSQQMGERVHAELAKGPVRAAFIAMSSSQWKKLQKNYGHLESTPELNVIQADNMVYASTSVKINNRIPESEVWFETPDGTKLAKIVGLEK